MLRTKLGLEHVLKCYIKKNMYLTHAIYSSKARQIV